MFFQDDLTGYPNRKIHKSGEMSKDGARRTQKIWECAQDSRWIVDQSAPKMGNSRPFYRRPTRQNQRHQSYKFWLVVTSLLVIGYFITLFFGPSTLRASSQKEAFVFTNSTIIKDEIQLAPVAARPSSTAKTPEVELASLPGRIFLMGDGKDGLKDARPHKVILRPFKIAKYEVSFKLWESVRVWGLGNGYADLPAGNGKAPTHPVYGISWVDAVKWCNALSEKEGLTPCYYTETSKQVIARKGIVDIGNQHVKWEADGYRLPTEAEWEFSARGGLSDKRFPWGDEITHELANYHGSSLIEYDKSKHQGTATALMSGTPYTAAVGSFRPNGFGLYDMAGNVSEWCWDFYEPDYGTPASLLENPHGPDKGQNCIIRGGSWRHTGAEARCANRFCQPGDLSASYIGFRIVRRS